MKKTVFAFAAFASTALAQAPTSAKPTGIVIAKYWDAQMQGSSQTIKDLGRVLTRFANPAPNMGTEPGLTLFQGVTYLMPLPEAMLKLGLKGRVPSKNKVICPGFPKDSFFYVAFDGIFEGHYNRLFLVMDLADQVVCVQLVDETPKKQDDYYSSYYFEPNADWHTYNFVNFCTKATSRLRIDHRVFYGTRYGGWNQVHRDGYVSRERAQTRLFRIDSLLVDPDGEIRRDRNYVYPSRTWKPLESVRWYVPVPLAELILESISRAGAKSLR